MISMPIVYVGINGSVNSEISVICNGFKLNVKKGL